MFAPQSECFQISMSKFLFSQNPYIQPVAATIIGSPLEAEEHNTAHKRIK
jgi:hypothetical protein